MSLTSSIEAYSKCKSSALQY